MTVFVTNEAVATEIATRLSQISIANGSETDIGLRVQEGRRRLPAEDEVPCIQLVEGNDDLDDEAGRSQSARIKVSQSYVLDAFDNCDPDNPNRQAHKMIRDLKRAIFQGDRTFGGKVFDVRYLGKDIGPRPDGKALVQARIAIRVSFAEDLSNP
jgi:hypothetical protein